MPITFNVSSIPSEGGVGLVGPADWRAPIRTTIASEGLLIHEAATPEAALASRDAARDRADIFIVSACVGTVQRLRTLTADVVPMPFILATSSRATSAGELLNGGADAAVEAGAPGLLVAQLRAGLRRTERQRAFLERVALLGERASTDPLTGLANRRVFDESLEEEVSRSHRHHRPFSLAVLDIDHFKQVNDRHGHQAGDHVLATIAAHLAAPGRPGETVARIGGEEFAILLPEADQDAGTAACERRRMTVASLQFPGIGRVTISAGVATLGESESASDLVEQADRALYRAKQTGRDRVMRATREPLRPTRVAAQAPVEAYLHAAERFDQAELLRLATERLGAGGLAGLLTGLLEPAFDEVGRRWESGEMSAAAEHLVTGMSEKLLHDISEGDPTGEGPMIVLAATPRNAHRLGLLAAGDLWAAAGWRPVVLGAHTPLEGVAEIALGLDARAVGVSVGTLEDLVDLDLQLMSLAHMLPGRTVFVGGNALRRDPLWVPPPGVVPVRGAAECERLARRLLRDGVLVA